MSTSSSSSDNTGGSYVETEVKTIPGYSRQYHAAVFPKAPKGGKPYPAFGTKAFPAPVRLRSEQAAAEISEDEESSDDGGGGGGFRKFKKRRHYVTRKDEKWVLSDKRGSKSGNTLHGELEGQTARYFIFEPPSEQGQAFRVMPVDKWIKFTKPPNFTAFRGKEIKEIENASNTKSKLEEMMQRRKQRQVEDAERSSKLRASVDELAAPQDGGLLLAEDDMDTKAAARTRGRGGGGRNMGDGENDGVDQGNEEDIDVMAIDRTGGGRGEGNGDADFEEEFQDDEDDKDLLKEEEDAVANEESLIQGAEEVAEAISSDDEESDSQEEGEEEEEEANKNMEALLERRSKAGGLDEEEDEEARASVLASMTSRQQRTKLIDENDKRPASTLTVKPTQQPVRKKVKTPAEVFKDSVIEVARQSGGSINVKTLFKLTTKKKNLQSCAIDKKEAKKLLSTLLADIFDLREDVITGETTAELKA